MPNYKNVNQDDFHRDFDVKTFDSFESYKQEMDTYLPMTDQEFYLNAKQIIEKTVIIPR